MTCFELVVSMIVFGIVCLAVAWLWERTGIEDALCERRKRREEEVEKLAREMEERSPWFKEFREAEEAAEKMKDFLAEQNGSPGKED